jgi:hypothetical protein
MKELKYTPCFGVNVRIDTAAKMKDFIPSLQKYTSPDLAEETFSEIYHWTFTYLRENGMQKVVELDVEPFDMLKVDRNPSVTSPLYKSGQ